MSSPKPDPSVDGDSSGEDDLVKGVPEEEEIDLNGDAEHSETGNDENGESGANSETQEGSEYDPNFTGTAPTQSWTEGDGDEGDEGEDEDGNEVGDEREGGDDEGDGEDEGEGGDEGEGEGESENASVGGYPNEAGDDEGETEGGEGEGGEGSVNGRFSSNAPVYSEDSMDPYSATAEEGDVDVEGDAATAARRQVEDEDEEDVDVDGDTGMKARDSDIDIGGESSRGPEDEMAVDQTTPTNYEEEEGSKGNKVATSPVAAPIFEPEYEPLDFEKGNMLHKEAFYTEWEKYVCDQDELEEILVPIRLDVTIDNHKVQDTFIWNLKEKSITPDQYAEMLCIDMDLPARAERLIADSIRQQLGEHRDLVPPLPSATARPVKGIGALPECLVTIKLDLTLNQVLLHDQFEWDVNNPSNAPEPFARSMCQDLGLSREFEATIAHAIREQLAFHAQYTVPVLQQTNSRQHYVVTTERCVREEPDLAVWTPIVQNVAMLAQRAQMLQQQPSTAQLAGNYTHTPHGPVRHSSRLREAASQSTPYSRANTTPQR